MKGKKPKSLFGVIITLIIILFVNFAIDGFSEKTNIPISLGDILFIPLSILLVVIILNSKLSSNDEIILKTVKQRVINSLVFLLISALSIFIIYTGSLNPLSCFTSVKGSAHGYTLIFLGVSGLFLGLFGIWKTVFIKTNKSKN